MKQVPWAFIPTALVIDGWLGDLSATINGEYTLQPTYVYGHPTWAKQSPAGRKVAFILRDYCGAWLISPDRDGKRKKCHGWASADARDCGAELGGQPWECIGNWRSARKNWDKDPSVIVTPALTTAWQECSPDDEARVIKKFGDIDIVILWVNGSDPTWRRERRQVCADYQWERQWPEAVVSSKGVKRCLQDEQSRVNGTVDPLAIDAKTSRCFQDFIDPPCEQRLIRSSEHDELRYLMRSLDQHLRWHTGRIILVVPKEQRPTWLKPSDRLQVLSQEVLIEAAMASPLFQQERDSYFAPSRIFNDFPVELSLPFLPGATDNIMLLQDDTLLARPVKPCELFTQHGLQLFAATYVPLDAPNPYTELFFHLLTHTARLWENFTASSQSIQPVPFHRIYHAPTMLNVATLEAVWRQWPREMSAALDSAFRQPWLLDIVGLHHSWVAQRSREARVQHFSKKNNREDVVNATSVFDTVSTSRIVDLEEYDPDKEPIESLRYVEVNYKNISGWAKAMTSLKPEPAQLPMLINFQDLIDAEDGQEPELDCLREQWLRKLLPDPSIFEDPLSPPNKCVGVQDLRNSWTFIPPALVVRGGQRQHASLMNGEYTLQPDFRYGHPTWARQLSTHGKAVAFILRDACGAWLISPHSDGNGKKCNGWAFAEERQCGAEPAGRPWECIDNWQVPGRDGWSKDSSIVVRAHIPHGEL